MWSADQFCARLSGKLLGRRDFLTFTASAMALLALWRLTWPAKPADQYALARERLVAARGSLRSGKPATAADEALVLHQLLADDPSPTARRIRTFCLEIIRDAEVLSVEELEELTLYICQQWEDQRAYPELAVALGVCGNLYRTCFGDPSPAELRHAREHYRIARNILIGKCHRLKDESWAILFRQQLQVWKMQLAIDGGEPGSLTADDLATLRSVTAGVADPHAWVEDLHHEVRYYSALGDLGRAGARHDELQHRLPKPLSAWHEMRVLLATIPFMFEDNQRTEARRHLYRYAQLCKDRPTVYHVGKIYEWADRYHVPVPEAAETINRCYPSPMPLYLYTVDPLIRL